MKFCAHPWVGIDIDPQGHYRPCCKFSQSLGTSLSEYQTNPLLDQLRQQFLNGEQPSQCQRCWQDEAAGLPSQRTMDHQWLDVTDLSNFQSVGVAFGNRCNLACRTCDSYASSAWLQDTKALGRISTDIKLWPRSTFHQDQSFAQDLNSISGNLKRVIIHGGDPFLSGLDQHLNYLDFLIENGAEDIKLTYITNTTVWPPDEFWQRWPVFGSVNITMSIDAVGEKFEYIRYPAQWNRVYNNIKRYQQAARDQEITVSISHTVSVLNVLDLPEFILWCRRERLPDPYLGMVTEPELYSVRNLPDIAKQHVAKKFTAIKKLEPVIKYLDNPGTNCDYHTVFSTLDSRRDQNFAKTFPEIAQLILG